MADPNAKQLAANIPQCYQGCFQSGVATAGCSKTDYNCWCYQDDHGSNHHQIIVDTMYECINNQVRRLGKQANCTSDESFLMEQNYWKICEQYWEPTGTATEPTGATSTIAPTTSTKARSISTTTRLTSSTTIKAKGTEQAQRTSAADLTSIQPNQGLSPGAKAGIAIGIVLGVIFLGLMFFLWRRERGKRQILEERVFIAEKAANEAVHVPTFEMEGDRPTFGELRGDMRTPELPDDKGLIEKDARSIASESDEDVSPTSARSSQVLPDPGHMPVLCKKTHADPRVSQESTDTTRNMLPAVILPPRKVSDSSDKRGFRRGGGR